MESLLGEEQVSSSQTSIMAQKRLNFWSAHWITPEFLQQLQEAIYLVVAMKSQHCEVNLVAPDESNNSKELTFDPTVASCPNFYSSFRNMFSLW
jgi:hypothetical protein